MKDHKETVKRFIQDRFREINADADDIIPYNWIVVGLLPKLNPKEKESLGAGVEELQKEGLIEVRNSGDLVLTKKGVDTIYE